MELSPKEAVNAIRQSYYDAIYIKRFEPNSENIFSIECAKIDIQGKIDLLSELNSTKLCKFDKEIDYWNEVLKELESL